MPWGHAVAILVDVNMRPLNTVFPTSDIWNRWTWQTIDILSEALTLYNVNTIPARTAREWTTPSGWSRRIHVAGLHHVAQAI